MSESDDLRKLETHFAFGDNWASYADQIDAKAIERARQGMARLLPEDEIRGRSFLDIGCGSGVHSLAACALGAAKLLAIDIDPKNVDTTRTLLERHAASSAWTVSERSVFDLSRDDDETYDIVYSWGVLHHTGDMANAIAKAAGRVASGGKFVFALYRRTWIDRFWIAEKRWYAKAHPRAQRHAQSAYITLLRAYCWLRGRSFRRYVETYGERGMDFRHDLHDWLGGYPYEAIDPPEVQTMMSDLGFEKLREIVSRKSIGVFGSGCDEYVYRRK